MMGTGFHAGRQIVGSCGTVYEVTSGTPLGAGASAAVYAGVAQGTGQAVAIKVIDRLDVDDGAP